MQKKNLLFFVLILFNTNLSAQYSEIYREDFNDKYDATWTSKNDASFEFHVTGGNLIMQHKQTAGCAVQATEIAASSNRDYYFETRLKQISGPTDEGYGLVWGGEGGYNNTFCFDIASDGWFRVWEYKDGNYVEIKKLTASAKIKGMGEYNTLAVEKRGGKQFFYINGETVFMTYARAFMGTYAGFVLGKSMTVAADYFSVKAPERKINLVSGTISKYNKENMGTAINSPYSEIAPVISPDEKTLFVARANHPGNVAPGNQYDIWYSTLQKDGKWSPLKNIGAPLNNSGDNVVISITPDNNTLWVEGLYNSDGSYQSDQGISVSYRTSTGWSLPKKIDIKNYYNRNEYESFCPTNDRTVIVMSVQRDDVIGKKDMYVSFLQDDGSYSEPLNMGNVINSYDEEGTPFIASDNKTLYFYSMTEPGYGDADIFVSKRLDDSWTKWSTPQNLGPKINTSAWDVYYTVAAKGDYAYLVSSANSFGNEDIFRIKLTDEEKPDPVVMLSGRVLDKKTNKPIETSVLYEDQKTGKTVGYARSNPTTGEYQLSLSYGVAYNIHAKKKNYFPTDEELDLTKVDKYKEVKQDLWMTPVEVGTVINLKSVHFFSTQDVLTPESYPELKRLVTLMKENPAMTIELHGHTESTKGYEKQLMALSQKRVEAVTKFLNDNGISSDRVVGKAFGGTQPIADNGNEDGRKLNRRVEFKVLKM
jgi:outer membrane protein OmpA-like peptidoglycan-associated protein